MRKLKPQIYPSTIIRSLDAITSRPDTDFDPILDHHNWVEAFEPHHYYTVTCEATQEVYHAQRETLDIAGYQKPHIDCLKSFLNSPRP